MKSLPKPPPWLGRDASREWNKLAASSFSGNQLDTVAAYCVVLAAWTRLREVTVDQQAGKSIDGGRPNPMMALEMELGEQVAELAAALDLEVPTSVRRPTRVLVLDEGEGGENGGLSG
jgi:phage terminase small subunit